MLRARPILLLYDMATLRGHFRGLANDRNLRRFVVQARFTGRQLGTGSYGTVEEVIANGRLILSVLLAAKMAMPFFRLR